jgi:hypothetical protein
MMLEFACHDLGTCCVLGQHHRLAVIHNLWFPLSRTSTLALPHTLVL